MLLWYLIATRAAGNDLGANGAEHLAMALTALTGLQYLGLYGACFVLLVFYLFCVCCFIVMREVVIVSDVGGG